MEKEFPFVVKNPTDAVIDAVAKDIVNDGKIPAALRELRKKKIEAARKEADAAGKEGGREKILSLLSSDIFI